MRPGTPQSSFQAVPCTPHSFGVMPDLCQGFNPALKFVHRPLRAVSYALALAQAGPNPPSALLRFRQQAKLAKLQPSFIQKRTKVRIAVAEAGRSRERLGPLAVVESGLTWLVAGVPTGILPVAVAAHGGDRGIPHSVCQPRGPQGRFPRGF